MYAAGLMVIGNILIHTKYVNFNGTVHKLYICITMFKVH